MKNSRRASITSARDVSNGKNDLAVFSGGSWSIKKSENGSTQSISFGQSGDVPVPSAYVP